MSTTLRMTAAASVLLAIGAFAVRAEEDLAQKVTALVKQLEDNDATVRATAEKELRKLDAKALPLMMAAKVEKNEGKVLLRGAIVDLAVATSGLTVEDATRLMQIGREEALDKRYANAARCYRRAEKVYQRLKDDAGDRNDKTKRREYADLEDKADNRADRAEALAKGKSSSFTGLNLGIVRVGAERDAKDEDW